MWTGSVFAFAFLRVAALVLVYVFGGVEGASSQGSAAPTLAQEAPASAGSHEVPVQHRAEVRVLYDEQALYVGARMYDDSPGAIARQLVRRDETGQLNFFELSLDPNLDLRTGYVFQISAAGVVFVRYWDFRIPESDTGGAEPRRGNRANSLLCMCIGHDRASGMHLSFDAVPSRTG